MAYALQAGTFRGLIFDCDGTLVETLPAHVAALQATLAPFGIRPTMEWAGSLYGTSPPLVLLAAEKEYGPIHAPHGEVLKTWAANYVKNLHRATPVAKVCETAAEWKGRVPMAVASNGHRRNIEATLAASGLEHMFDFIVSVEDVEHGKPAPDLFLEAARRMNLAPEDVLIFEDSREGMDAAKAAGMRAIRVVQEQPAAATHR